VWASVADTIARPNPNFAVEQADDLPCLNAAMARLVVSERRHKRADETSNGTCLGLGGIVIGGFHHQQPTPDSLSL